MKNKIYKYLPWIITIILLGCIVAGVIFFTRPTGTTGSGTGGDEPLQITGNFMTDSQSF